MLEKYEVCKTQPVMERIFPNMKDYDMNTLTPCVYKNDEGKTMISMLILADDNRIKDFRADKDGRATVDICTCSEDNKNGCGKDLSINLEFHYPTGHPIFETVISGDLGEGQKKFVEALKEVKDFMIWIANKRRKAEKVMIVEWNYNIAKDILEELL